MGHKGNAGSAFSSRRAGGAAKSPGRACARRQCVNAGPAGIVADLDFLGSATPMLTNLRPGADGTVHVKLADLGAGQHIHVIALDARERVYASLALPEAVESARSTPDLRARSAPSRRTPRHRVVKSGGSARSTGRPPRCRLYDWLDDVFQYFRTRSDAIDASRSSCAPSLKPGGAARAVLRVRVPRAALLPVQEGQVLLRRSRAAVPWPTSSTRRSSSLELGEKSTAT
jgi:hypothetical protein